MLLEMFWMLQTGTNSIQRKGHNKQHWQKPSPQELKFNTNAVVVPENEASRV